MRRWSLRCPQVPWLSRPHSDLGKLPEYWCRWKSLHSAEVARGRGLPPSALQLPCEVPPVGGPGWWFVRCALVFPPCVSCVSSSPFSFRSTSVAFSLLGHVLLSQLLAGHFVMVWCSLVQLWGWCQLCCLLRDCTCCCFCAMVNCCGWCELLWLCDCRVVAIVNCCGWCKWFHWLSCRRVAADVIFGGACVIWTLQDRFGLSSKKGASRDCSCLRKLAVCCWFVAGTVASNCTTFLGIV